MAAGLPAVAQSLQSKGRGYDDHLVHMSGKELAGLQALAQQHGGSLTKNPKTGLYEAGFLEAILPTVVGAGLSMMGVPAWGAALGGGLAGLATKGTLMGGVMGALGGFGGGSLVESFISAGIEPAMATSLAASVGETGLAANAEGLLQMGMQAGLKGAELAAFIEQGGAASLAPTATAAATPVTNAVQGLDNLKTVNTMTNAAQPLPDAPYGDPYSETMRYSFAPQQTVAANPADLPYGDAYAYRDAFPTKVMQPPTGSGGMDQMWRGAKTIGQQLFKDPKKTVREYGVPALAAAAPMLAGSFDAQNAAGIGAGLAPATRKNYTYNPPRPIPGMPGHYYNPSFTPYAAGGIAGLGSNGPELPPRMVSGDGDGVSDSVPALINGRKPAAMADGEFVVPARIVSEIGNGSTNAGAKRLYAMMDRVQKARNKTVGKGKVAVDSKAHRMLPV